MKSCVTISLVPSLQGGPWILWDDLTTSCRKANELGFDAVELFTEGPSAGDPGELGTLLEENGLALGAVGTGAGKVLHGWSLTDPGAEIRQKAKRFISEMITFGAMFDAPAIIGSMQGSHGNGVSRGDALKYLTEALEELGEIASKASVKLIYEPLNRYETNLFNRFNEAAEFLDGLSTMAVTLLADLFHMNIEETCLADAIRTAGSHIGHVHFVDSNRRAAGMGHIDYQPVMAALAEIGYDGYLCAEALPYPDSQQAAEQTINCYRQCTLSD